jgi:CubicO group peptidase (beta-lactamase class C family)
MKWTLLTPALRFVRRAVCLAMLTRQVSAQDGSEDANSLLEPIRQKHQLPALAAAAVVEGRTVAIGATGVRKFGGTEAVTNADLWHLGSCTKSMTASLAGILVQEGKIKWDTKVADVFPAIRGRMHRAWREVTLEQLLTHRSGAPADAPAELWMEAGRQMGRPRDQRLAFVRGLVERAPEAPPGTKFIYSNQGYAMAGAMLEQIGGQPFETLLKQRLFDPLGMKSAGFGAPGQPGKVDQPWGHIGSGAVLQPIEPGPQADNPPAITPAGRVHCSIADFARYAAWHARGATRGATLLSDATFTKLHAAASGQDYAMGWVVTERAWGGGTVLTHAGSNTMWFCVVWIAPVKEVAVVATTNAAGPEAEKACDEAVGALLRRFLPAK